MAYILDDDTVDYEARMDAKDNGNIVVCKDCFEFNTENDFTSDERNDLNVGPMGEISRDEFVKKFPKLQTKFIKWVNKCVGSKKTNNIFRNFKDNHDKIKFAI